MNEEIERLIFDLEGCCGMFDYMLTPLENSLLVSYIKDLQQKNKQLKNRIEDLEKWLEEEIKHYKEHFEFICKSTSPVPIDDTKIILEKDDLIIQKLESTLNKLQELKGSENNE